MSLCRRISLTRVIAARTASGPDHADRDAWQLPTGLYLEAVGSCSQMIIGKQAADGTVQEVSVPGSSGGNVVIATSTSEMLVRGYGWCQGSCAQDSTLAWFNPATGTVQQVLTPQPGSIGGRVQCRRRGPRSSTHTEIRSDNAGRLSIMAGCDI